MNIHVVRSGDTLWRISQFYGISINQIIAANGLENPNRLVVGEALVIPTGYQTYVVQPGDALWSIAKKFGVSVQQIVDVNQLADPSTLYIGQVLNIPIITHTVKRGETLWKIANKYGTTISTLASLNNIQNLNSLFVGQKIRVPEKERPRIDVNTYMYSIGQKGADLLEPVAPLLTYVSPFSHGILEDGSITELNDGPSIQVARNFNVAPLLVLTNIVGSKFSSDRAALILRNRELQDTLINNILTKMKSKGYSGLNIDFEYVYPEDRENYNNFLRNVVSKLRPEGYSVSTAVAPKVREDQQGLLYEAHDYRAHGEIVDFVVIMTYEWGWSGGEPLAIAPINSVKQVLDYAVTAIPRNKIMMGIPLYGRDWKIPWVKGTYAKTVGPKSAVDLAAKYGVSIQYDEVAQSPYFRYTDESGQQHEVWFEDARSMQAKYDTVKQYGLRGVSYWVLQLPFPQNWPVLAENFKPNKKQ